jgi:hypothetical protein
MAVFLVAVLLGIAPARTQNLVTNGNFSSFSTTVTQSFQFGTYNSYTPPATLTGWASAGYNYVFLPSSTTATGTYGNLSLWSPATGSSNGFTNASPTGGNFVAADSDYGTLAITQTINGLTVGRTYTLSFAWAGAQQSGYTGATTDAWQVTLGSTMQQTQTINVASQGFSGWMTQTFNYVATSTSEVLSFLATGSPAVPPFALLANVSLTAAPEPSSVTALLSGLAGLLGFVRYRGRRASKTVMNLPL